MLNYTSIKTGGHARLLTSPRYVTLSLLVSVGDGGREGQPGQPGGQPRQELRHAGGGQLRQLYQLRAPGVWSVSQQ